MTTAHSITDLTLDKLVEFENHPFKPYTGQRFDDMAASIKENGLLSPLIVRPKGELFEILAGHNRYNAAKAAGLLVVPCDIRTDLNDNEAKQIVTLTNLLQRSFADLSHSERAAVVTTHYEAIKSQGKRNDLVSDVEKALKARTTSSGIPDEVANAKSVRDVVALNYELSANTLAIYLLVDDLVPELKSLLDEGKIKLSVCEVLHRLNNDVQVMLADVLIKHHRRLSLKQAEAVVKAAKRKGVDETVILEAIQDTRKPRDSSRKFTFQSADFSNYFDNEQSDEEIENVILAVLEAYRKSGKV
jgi:ParB family chromosome partitioning protein